MKKLFTTILLAVAIAAPSFSQDTIVKPKTVISITKTTELITLDGAGSENSWTAATDIKIERGDSLNSEGFKASFKAIWDNDYIYILITAIDENPYEYDGSNSWEKDGVQIYFDIRDSLVLHNKMVWQHTLPFCYAMTHATMDALSDFPIWNDSTLATYADLGTSITADGWIIEARIPIVSLYYDGDAIADYESCVAYKKYKVNDTIGFAIQANNYNATLATPARTAVLTYPGGSDTWNNSASWGGLKLVEANNSINNISTTPIEIYPNPVADKIKIDLDGLNSVEIIDISGKVVFKQIASSNSLTINVSGLSSGLYFVKANGKTNAIQKIIKR